MSYREKYLKYKHKYLTLKKSLNESNNCVHNFFFTHLSPWNNFIQILKDGVIYPNKFLDKKHRYLSGIEENHVFTNIYFDNVNLIPIFYNLSFILHPKILYENGLFFNKAWGGNFGSIEIKMTDSPQEINSKLNQIRDFLINPQDLPELLKTSGNNTHEVLFDHPINLDDNLLAIVCYPCEEKYIEEIRKIIKNKPYSNVNIITDSNRVLTLDELLTKSFIK